MTRQEITDMMRRDAMGRFRPVSRRVRFNPYEKVGKYVGRKFSVARGPRAGDFKVLGRGIGNTAAIEYAGGEVGTYAVQYPERKQPRYYPNRYISQLAYRRSEKGLAALARARKAAAKARKEAAKAERASETAKQKAKKAKEKAKKAERKVETAIVAAPPAPPAPRKRRKSKKPAPGPSFAERFGAGSPEPLRPRFGAGSPEPLRPRIVAAPPAQPKPKMTERQIKALQKKYEKAALAGDPSAFELQQRLLAARGNPSRHARHAMSYYSPRSYR
jgi:hypothetical protein